MDPLRNLVAAIAGPALCGGIAFAQLEGPLDNDCFLPVDAAAEAELARGDQAFLLAIGARPHDGDDRARTAAWTPVCEAWRNALVRSQRGASAGPRPLLNSADSSPWPAPEGSLERFTEGIEAALFRRLAALPEQAHGVWEGRFAALAQREFERAGSSPKELARIERDLPATSGAARAALLLAELAFERGDPAASRSWLSRARRHVALQGTGDPAILRGIALRERSLPLHSPAGKALWQSASSLEFVIGHDLETTRGSVPRARPLGAGPQAGLASLGSDRVLIQTASALWILSAVGAQLSGPYDNNAWLRPAGFEVEPSVAPGNAPGWRLDPCANASSAVLVAGRSFGGRSNVLACVDFGPADGEPQVRWALGAARASPSKGALESDDEYEFQPGPLWTEGLVVALVRRSSAASGEHELELRALEPATGALRWSTYLGKGGERVRDSGRFVRRGVASMPAEPLLATADGIFAGAPLGFAALIEPLDGRARFAVRNHRRDGAERGWTGWGSALADHGGSIAWAPADAEHLYVLDLAGPGQRGTPLIGPPQPMGEAEALVGADASQALVLSRSGARWALSHWDLASGSRRDALHLGPEEVFAGRALASPERLLASSDRALYLFDRGADFALLAAVTLGGPIPRGGNVWAAGKRVFVLSNRHVEVFMVR